MSESLVLTPSTRALVVAMRLWHFDRENWWTKMQPLGARLDRRAGMELLMALDGLMTVLAEHARCDIALRPVACRRITVEERAFVGALENAASGDHDGCRHALRRFLDGENLRFAQSLLTDIAGHLGTFAATLDTPEVPVTPTLPASAAAHC